MKTCLTIQEDKFFINGEKTYSEIAGCDDRLYGLLMNARFIQGIFDDKSNPERFNRFGRIFDSEKNTDDLIAALSQWYQYGLRAFTVGLQGGGPCFTMDNNTIDNNPFGEDGLVLDEAYANRLHRLIQAADELGMVVIVSILYGSQAMRLQNEYAILQAIRTTCAFLKEAAYTNVMIEIANEHDVKPFTNHPIIKNAETVACMIHLAKELSGGIPVGCSGMGGSLNEEICKASDVIFIHGNGLSRQQYYNLITRAKKWGPGKPIVCNEDSQAIGQLKVAFETGTSWGYYNNMTKQEPPCDWAITMGEDRFFAQRMAMGLGIPVMRLWRKSIYGMDVVSKRLGLLYKCWIKEYKDTIFD